MFPGGSMSSQMGGILSLLPGKVTADVDDVTDEKFGIAIPMNFFRHFDS